MLNIRHKRTRPYRPQTNGKIERFHRTLATAGHTPGSTPQTASVAPRCPAGSISTINTGATPRSEPHPSADSTTCLDITPSRAAGVAVALQARYNGELGAELGDPILATVISCSVGLAALFTVAFVHPAGRACLRDTLVKVRQRVIPLWMLTGGFTGAFLVLAQSTVIHALGVALFSVGIVAG